MRKQRLVAQRIIKATVFRNLFCHSSTRCSSCERQTQVSSLFRDGPNTFDVVRNVVVRVLKPQLRTEQEYCCAFSSVLQLYKLVIYSFTQIIITRHKMYSVASEVVPPSRSRVWIDTTTLFVLTRMSIHRTSLVAIIHSANLKPGYSDLQILCTHLGTAMQQSGARFSCDSS